MGDLVKGTKGIVIFFVVFFCLYALLVIKGGCLRFGNLSYCLPTQQKQEHVPESKNLQNLLNKIVDIQHNDFVVEEFLSIFPSDLEVHEIKNGVTFHEGKIRGYVEMLNTSAPNKYPKILNGNDVIEKKTKILFIENPSQ